MITIMVNLNGNDSGHENRLAAKFEQKNPI